METTLEDGENPIERLEVVCSESQGIVNLDVIPSAEQADFEAANGGGGVLGVGGGGGSNAAAMQWRHVIYAKINSTQTKVTEIEDFQVSKLAQLENRIRNIERMTHALSVSPARIIRRGRRRGGGDMPERLGNPAVEEPAVLGRCPKTLFVLWDEWVNGIGGSKPARDFTRCERGLKQNKFKYCNRLIIWKCMERLISRGGNTVSVAVRKIKSVYGKCVSKIIRKMRPDERNGGHAQLQV